MKNRFRWLLAVLLTVIVTLLGMAAGFYFNSSPQQETIILPQKADGENIDIEDIRRENVRIVEKIEVTSENVLTLVSQLRRPLEYHFKTENTVFSGEKSRVTTTEGFVKGTKAKVTQSENGRETICYLLTDNSLYLWESGKRTFEKMGKGSFSYDDAAFVAPYEELSAFESIENARTVVENGEFFIEITGKREDSQIDETYVIAVSSGLVTEVTFADGKETLAKTTVTLIGTDEIADSVFLLPNNTNPT